MNLLWKAPVKNRLAHAIDNVPTKDPTNPLGYRSPESTKCQAKSSEKHNQRKRGFKSVSNNVHDFSLFGLSQGFFNFLVRLVLPKGVDRPNHGWNPTNQRELHHKTEKTCKRTTNREEGQPWQQKRNQKSHGWDVRIVLHRTQVSTGWLTTNLHWSLK